MDHEDGQIARWRWWVLAGTGALGLLFLGTGVALFARTGGFEEASAPPAAAPPTAPAAPREGATPEGGDQAFQNLEAPRNLEAPGNPGNNPGDDLRESAPDRAAPTPPPTALGYYQQGEAAQNRGDLPTAIAAYREAILRDPKLDLARLNLAIALSQSDRAAEALAEFDQAARFLPDSADLHYHWGNAYGKADRPADAIAAYRRALLLNPTYADAHYNLGNTFAKAGELSSAADAYRAAISANPAFAEAHGNLGLILLQQGDRAAARQALTQARDQFQRTNRRDRAAAIQQTLGQLAAPN